MSYEIIYGKQFIKINDNCIIPMMLAGSSNCYECTGARVEPRSRDYSPMFPIDRREGEYKHNGIFATPEYLIRTAEKDINYTVERELQPERLFKDESPRTAEQIKKKYGWYVGLAINGHTSKTTAGMYLGLFKDGIKKAMSIEELMGIGIHLKFYEYKWSEDKYSIEPPEYTTIYSTEQFLETYELWDKWRNECIVTDKEGKTKNPCFYVTFSGRHRDITDKLTRYRQMNKPEIKKEEVEQDHYFALKNDKGDYLIKYTGRGYRYSWRSPGKKFQTQKLAERYLDKLIKTGKHLAETWKIERIEREMKFMKAV